MPIRMVAIVIQRAQGDDELFAPKIAEALREYAEEIDAGRQGSESPEVFPALNGCRIQVIAGSAS